MEKVTIFLRLVEVREKKKSILMFIQGTKSTQSDALAYPADPVGVSYRRTIPTSANPSPRYVRKPVASFPLTVPEGR